MKIFFLIISFIFLYANDNNLTELNMTKEKILKLNTELSKNSFYLTYKNYIDYQKLLNTYNKLKYLSKKNPRYKKKLLTIQTQLDLLKENENIFNTLIKLKNIPKAPQIENPFEIFSAINYEKQIKNVLLQNIQTYQQFKETLNNLKKLYKLKKEVKIKDNQLENMINDFELINTIYKKKLETLKTFILNQQEKIKKEIKNQLNKLAVLIAIIIFLIIFSFILKFILKKYIKEENLYISNKIINILTIFIIVLTSLLFYINNATYIITILGFISAGIAIAMKDWFMNIFGWFVIMINGNIKVGDRIKMYLQNGNVQIVGDVIDITLTRIVIYEDVTYTTYHKNRRAGRIVFIPNNVVFNNPIFNYTHKRLATVWDGIDITLTFDSNYKKAVDIIKNILTNQTKRQSAATKTRMQRLKIEYNFKSYNLEPRVLTLIEENGIRISAWYLVISTSPLIYRSQISGEILDALLKEKDIKITYPTYKINGNINIQKEKVEKPY
ncbi:MULTISPECIES: mechanosensitive ion channel family protein [unclassified Lebetimonas]|uniref:mechanosensitive ion channel family protein n=1 Tax=unclassified Lebetimonas TaxID=2648158 RepID=UPI00046339E3|nr:MULTISPECIES: mechanosensitive ion channel domain-containing protein [unclassified Lebetimonas]